MGIDAIITLKQNEMRVTERVFEFFPLKGEIRAVSSRQYYCSQRIWD